MPGRTYTSGSGYRYGFNGKENDNEVKGEGNQQDYGMRIYDPRVGRFLSVDPLTKNYPWYTPYQFAGNKPIKFVDLDGMEEGLVQLYYWLRPKIKSTTVGQLVDGVYRNTPVGMADLHVKKVTAEFKENPLATLEKYSNPSKVLKEQAEGVVQTTKNAFTGKDAGAWIDLTVMAFGGVEAGKRSGVKLKTDLSPGTKTNGFSFSRSSPVLFKKVNDFILGHSEETILKSDEYNKIKTLSNEQLVQSVIKPKEYDPVTVNTITESVSDGNTRLYELRRRKLNIDVPYENYTPDRSMFPDPKEPPKKQ